jgi:hypothetical protein
MYTNAENNDWGVGVEFGVVRGFCLFRCRCVITTVDRQVYLGVDAGTRATQQNGRVIRYIYGKTRESAKRRYLDLLSTRFQYLYLNHLKGTFGSYRETTNEK